MQGLVKRLLFGGIAGKVLGVLRELVAAWCFGTGLVANAYRLAQAAFLLPLHGFVSDVISGAFTPHYARLRADDPEAAQRLFAAMQRALLVVSVLVGIGLMLWGNQLVAVMAPGFSAEARALSAQFVTVLAPALPAYVLVGLYGGTELVHGAGRILAARASVQSAGLLLGTLAAWSLNKPILIAIGFAAAYFGLLIWALLINRSLGLLFFQKIGTWQHWKEALGPVLRVFAVLMWVPLALQVSQIVERRIASGLNANAVAALDYARFITETLLILIAMPFGMAGQAAMPTMDETTFKRYAIGSLRTLIVVGTPLSVFLWSQSQLIVEVAFKRGAFTDQSVAVTSTILSAQALGIVFLLLAYVAQKFLNARGRNIAVLWTAAIGATASVLVNQFFQSQFGVAVLGISVVVSGACIALLACQMLGVLGSLLRSTWALLLVGLAHALMVVVCRAVAGRNAALELSAGLLFWAALFTFHNESRKVISSGLTAIRRK